tara:strand:- start:33 stop:449 length:417 start_codon:yes stop_codon:yes gene_type:complete
MEELIKDVEFLISKDNLRQKNRKREKIHKRMYLYNILKDYGYSYVRIAFMFSKNHATVIHAIYEYKQLKEINDKILYKDTKEYIQFFKKRQKLYAEAKQKLIDLVDSNEYMIRIIERYSSQLIENLNLLNEKHKHLQN